MPSCSLPCARHHGISPETARCPQTSSRKFWTHQADGSATRERCRLSFWHYETSSGASRCPSSSHRMARPTREPPSCLALIDIAWPGGLPITDTSIEVAKISVAVHRRGVHGISCPAPSRYSHDEEGDSRLSTRPFRARETNAKASSDGCSLCAWCARLDVVWRSETARQTKVSGTGRGGAVYACIYRGASRPGLALRRGRGESL